MMAGLNTVYKNRLLDPEYVEQHGKQAPSGDDHQDRGDHRGSRRVANR